MDPEDLLRGLAVHPTSFEGLKVYHNYLRDEFIGFQSVRANAYSYISLFFQLLLELRFGIRIQTAGNLLWLFSSFLMATNRLMDLHWEAVIFDASYEIFSALVYDFEQETRYISLYDEEDVSLVWAILVLKPRQVLYVAARGAKALKDRFLGNAFRHVFQQELEYEYLYAVMAPEPGTHVRPTARRANARERQLFNFNRH